MYLKLKPNHIIRLSPSKPMLINTEEDIQIAISKIENTLVGRAKELTSEDHCSAYCEQCVRKIEKEFSSDQMYLSTFITDTLPQELRCGYYKWIINENGKIMPCAFFPENFSLGHICDPIESIFTPQKYSKMLKNLGKLAKDMSARGEQITNICEALYLVEE